MKLPCTYTHNDLSVDSIKVATIDKTKRQGYLDKIKAEVNANNNIEVTVLIGAKCTKSFEPHKLIASKKGFHMHSKHSWDGALEDPSTVKIQGSTNLIFVRTEFFETIGNGRVYNQWTVIFACCCSNSTIFTVKIKI